MPMAYMSNEHHGQFNGCNASATSKGDPSLTRCFNSSSKTLDSVLHPVKFVSTNSVQTLVYYRLVLINDLSIF